jgi:virulence factor Mce-like protein
VVAAIWLAVIAMITFLFLNNRFEGPDPTEVVGNPYELTARFENSKKLPSKQPVLYKGISIGRVNEVSWDAERKEAVVTFTLDDEFEIHADATMRIGERSLLGDPYLNLLNRGSEDEPELEAGDELTNTRPSVNFDEALAFLDEDGRRHVKSLIGTVGDGASGPGNGERLNGTIGGVNRTLIELESLTRKLRGQEERIAGLVSGASTVLSTIGEREQQVRTIVGSGRATLDSLASSTTSLDQALAELPGLLDSGTRSLAEAEPLLRDARPLVEDIRRLAPDLNLALSEEGDNSLGDVTRELLRTVEGLKPLRESAVPILGDLRGLLDDVGPLVTAIAPGARNLVPALDYLTPRSRAIASTYALIAASTAGVDEVGHYVRAAFDITDAGELLDLPTGPCLMDAAGNRGCGNAYPGPDDAADPQPFTGPYPRLVPCEVPSRETPRKPCE